MDNFNIKVLIFQYHINYQTLFSYYLFKTNTSNYNSNWIFKRHVNPLIKIRFYLWNQKEANIFTNEILSYLHIIILIVLILQPVFYFIFCVLAIIAGDWILMQGTYVIFMFL